MTYMNRYIETAKRQYILFHEFKIGHTYKYKLSLFSVYKLTIYF